MPVFPIYPENSEELSEAAQIARGELEYFLTSSLDGEGRESLEGDIEASVSVPMQIGHQIIGVLAADNYFTDQPITRNQVTPLQILANIGAVAFENARLYQELSNSYEEVFQELQQRMQAEEKLVYEYRWRAAEGAIRMSIALMEDPQDLNNVIKESGQQLRALGVEFENLSLQVINADGTDFVCIGEEMPLLDPPFWSQGLSWPCMSPHVQDYPWVIEVWKTKIPRYEPCVSEGSKMATGMSIIDVPFSHGTLAINHRQSHAFSEDDLVVLQQIADVITDGFQRYLDLIEHRRAEETLRASEDRLRRIVSGHL